MMATEGATSGASFSRLSGLEQRKTRRRVSPPRPAGLRNGSRKYSETATDGAELRRQTVGQQAKSDGDRGHDHAGDQTIFQRCHGAPVELQFKPGFRVLNHDKLPLMHMPKCD